MIKKFEGVKPDINKKTYIAEGGKVIGKVKLNEFCSIWHNTIVRGDVNKIEIGRYTNIQDNCVVHVGDDHPTIVGDFVTVGHGAILHGCVIEDHCLIGMGAMVLNGVEIGRGSVIAAGTVVKQGEIIPPYSMVVGVPGRIIKKMSKQLDTIHAQAVKYKTLWAERYGILPDAGGESYKGEEII